MAYQARGRDPLLDSKMAEIIEKRGKELLGIVMVVVALGIGAMFASYSPDDPGWMSAVDAPVQNWLGATGAKVSATLFMIVGWGAWGLAAVLLAWGLRFVRHRGQERAIGRLIFAPIWIAVLSLYAASVPPGVAWGETHSFGLGGLFGDTILGALLGMMPFGASAALKLLSLVFGLVTLGFGAFVLGFDRGELGRILRFLIVGVIMTYSGLVTLMGRGASGAVHVARTGHERHAERRAARSVDHEREVTIVAPRMSRNTGYVIEEEVTPEPEVAKPGGGLLSLMPSLIRRPEPMPEPELVELDVPRDLSDMPGEDRIREKIADVIKSRVRQNLVVQGENLTPLTRGRGRGPDPLVLQTSSQTGLPADPPLTADIGLPPEPPLTASLPETDFMEDLQPAVIEQTATRIPVAEPRKVVQHSPRKTA